MIIWNIRCTELGETGDAGRIGLKGIRGAQGQKGQHGLHGWKGATGDFGLQGEIGLDGRPGKSFVNRTKFISIYFVPRKKQTFQTNRCRWFYFILEIASHFISID